MVTMPQAFTGWTSSVVRKWYNAPQSSHTNPQTSLHSYLPRCEDELLFGISTIIRYVSEQFKKGITKYQKKLFLIKADYLIKNVFSYCLTHISWTETGSFTEFIVPLHLQKLMF